MSTNEQPQQPAHRGLPGSKDILPLRVLPSPAKQENLPPTSGAQVSQVLSKLAIGVPTAEIPKSMVDDLIRRSHGLYDADFLDELYDGKVLFFTLASHPID